MPDRLLGGRGPPTRPTGRQGLRASHGPQAPRGPVLRWCGSAWPRPPGVPGPPARGGRRRPTPRGNFPRGPKPTMRPCRLPTNARRPPRLQRKRRSALAASAASRQASGALRCARVATAVERARPSRRCGQRPRCMAYGGAPGSGRRRGARVDDSQATVLGWPHIPCHARPCCVRSRTSPTESGRGTVWCVNVRRSGSHRRLSYHWFPDARGWERPRAWLTLVGVDKVQLVGHLAHRWEHLLAKELQAGHPFLMATWAMGVPKAKDTGAQHFDELPELRDDGLRGPHDDLLIIQLGLVARVNMPFGFRNIFGGVRRGDTSELLSCFGVGEHAC